MSKTEKDEAPLMDVLKFQSDELATYLAGLPDEAWSGETACADWDVTTVVAHLAGAGKVFAERISQGVAGDTTTPEGLPEAGAVNGDSWAETNAVRWVDIRRDMGDHKAVLAHFRETAAGLDDLLASLDSHQRNSLCYHPGGEITVETMVGFRLLEVVLHTWDIRSKQGPSSALPPNSLPHIMCFLTRYLDWFFTPTEALSSRLRIRLSLAYQDGTASPPSELLLSGDSASIGPEGASPHAEITGSLEAFVLAMCGRLKWQSAFEGGELVCRQGDLARLLGQWFRGA